MSKVNYRQIYAVKAANEARIKKLCPNIKNSSGIYVLTREDELGIKYAYIGQAKALLKRVAEHLAGYQHIDLSIKKHGLYDIEKRPCGWRIDKLEEIPELELDEAERLHVTDYAAAGYQLRNKTTGGQDSGKKSIHDYGRGGYLKGKRDGAERATSDIGGLIVKYTTGLTSKGGAIADRKTRELHEILKITEV